MVIDGRDTKDMALEDINDIITRLRIEKEKQKKDALEICMEKVNSLIEEFEYKYNCSIYSNYTDEGISMILEDTYTVDEY